MDVAEFDKFADEYHNLHQENIRITGEKPEYFAEYQICIWGFRKIQFLTGTRLYSS